MFVVPVRTLRSYNYIYFIFCYDLCILTSLHWNSKHSRVAHGDNYVLYKQHNNSIALMLVDIVHLTSQLVNLLYSEVHLYHVPMHAIIHLLHLHFVLDSG